MVNVHSRICSQISSFPHQYANPTSSYPPLLLFIFTILFPSSSTHPSLSHSFPSTPGISTTAPQLLTLNAIYEDSEGGRTGSNCKLNLEEEGRDLEDEEEEEEYDGYNDVKEMEVRRV
jgi:hypothetical protein